MIRRNLIAALLLGVGSFGSAFAQSAVPTTNWSISVTTGLTYQAVTAKQGGRKSLTIQNNNTNTDNCWVNDDGLIAAGNTTSTSVTPAGGVAITAAKASILLQPGQSYTRYYPLIPNGPIVGTCTNAADSLLATVQ